MFNEKTPAPNLIKRLDQSLETWLRRNLPFVHRLIRSYANSLGQMDRKTFYITWWVLLLTAVIALIASIWL